MLRVDCDYNIKQDIGFILEAEVFEVMRNEDIYDLWKYAFRDGNEDNSVQS